MPNGVICGGAVDGSNQLGEIVTCQAIATRPDGGAAAAVEVIAPRAQTPANRSRKRAAAWSDVIGTLRRDGTRPCGPRPGPAAALPWRSAPWRGGSVDGSGSRRA